MEYAITRDVRRPGGFFGDAFGSRMRYSFHVTVNYTKEEAAALTALNKWDEPIATLEDPSRGKGAIAAIAPETLRGLTPNLSTISSTYNKEYFITPKVLAGYTFSFLDEEFMSRFGVERIILSSLKPNLEQWVNQHHAMLSPPIRAASPIGQTPPPAPQIPPDLYIPSKFADHFTLGRIDQHSLHLQWLPPQEIRRSIVAWVDTLPSDAYPQRIQDGAHFKINHEGSQRPVWLDDLTKSILKYSGQNSGGNGIYDITYRQLIDGVRIGFKQTWMADLWAQGFLSHMPDRIYYQLLEWSKNAPPTPPDPTVPETREADWYSHALILAQPGSGKTNAIRWRIAKLLPHIKEGKASLILLDPQGELLRGTLGVARRQGLGDRVTYIDPITAPVSVNVFDKGDGSPTALNQAIGHLTRVFGTISLALTEMQLTPMTFALRALFSLPEKPTIDSLINIFRKGKDGLPLDTLEPRVRNFFEHDYQPDRNIVGRLNTMLANPVYETLFDTERPSYDIGRDMQAGKLIIINAGSQEATYGRFWIEEIGRTIRSRLAIPENNRIWTTFIIDEAPVFVAEDAHFAEVLDRARAARIGAFIAAQHMEQFTDAHVKNSLYNCALKFVSRTNANIFDLCRSMGSTEPDFLTTTPQYQFAFFGPNMESAVRVKLPLTDFVQATSEDMRFYTSRSGGPSQEAPQEPPPRPTPPPRDDEPNVDDLALADAYAQLALAIRRGNTQRAAELQDHINGLTKRSQQSRQDGPTDDDPY